MISAFGKQFIQTGIFPREMGRDINLAFQKRQLGDYEYRFVISKGEAEELLDRGRGFVQHASDYLRGLAEADTGTVS